jgi:hypothetical protein
MSRISYELLLSTIGYDGGLAATSLFHVSVLSGHCGVEVVHILIWTGLSCLVVCSLMVPEIVRYGD